MESVYVHDHQIISPLGFSSEENIQALKAGKSGIQHLNLPHLADTPFFAGYIPPNKLAKKLEKYADPNAYSKIAQLLILALKGLNPENRALLQSPKTLVLLATTKGNVDALSNQSQSNPQQALLPELAKTLQHFFTMPQPPKIISHACISGGLALGTARDFLLYNDTYEQAVVLGADCISKFTLSGFEALKAMDDKPCQPFSAERGGINIGEAAAALVLKKNKPSQQAVGLCAHASANDANHISGPSRTAAGLTQSIQHALHEAEITAAEIDFISAHGTGTRYNDEMEAIAFSRTGLTHSPVNSLKGYYGHSFGAAALLESIITVESIRNQEIYASKGFYKNGVSHPLNIIKRSRPQKITYALKTASGFGGGNLALVFNKQ